MAKALPILFQNPLDLDKIDVAAPCEARWEDMLGSDRVRFCGSCEKNVFNLSGMRRDEAIDLLVATEGKVCVRFFRRADGTLLTTDCPVGVALLVRRAKRATLMAAAVSVGCVAALLAFIGGAWSTRASCQLQEVQQRIETVIPDIPDPMPTMGAPPAMPTMGDVDVPVPEMGKPAPSPKPRPKMGKVARPVEIKGGLG